MSNEYLKRHIDTSELTSLVKKSESVEDILQKTVTLISNRLQTEVCSIYLYQDLSQSLLLAATVGLTVGAQDIILKEGEGIAGLAIKELKSINVSHGSKESCFKSIKDINEEPFDSYLALPILAHREKIGVLVLQRQKGNAFTQKDELALKDVLSQLKDIIRHSKEVIDADFQVKRETEHKPFNIPLIKGRVASKGIAYGHPLIFSGFRSIQNYKEKQFSARYTKKDFLTSLEKTNQQLEELQNELKDNLTEVASMVFVGHQLILKDQAFRGEIFLLIESGVNPPQAIVKVASKYMDIFSQSKSDLIAEKAQDVEDIALRVLENLLSNQDNPLNFKHKIIITESLYPSDLLSLKSNQAKGVVMFGGGLTSHVSLIARSLNMPMILVDDKDIFKVQTSHHLLLDAYSGNIHIDPTAQIIEQVTQSSHNLYRQKETLSLIKEKTFSKDGEEIHLLANINLLNDLEAAINFKAQGIGLYRTEFPFMIRNDFPSEEEQHAIYCKLFEAFPHHPVTIRTLDIGGDKHLPYHMQLKEANPFLGLRSIRFTLKHQDIFTTQLRAILRAGVDVTNLRIMFPMVSSIEEIEQAKALLKQCIEELNKEGTPHNPSPRVGIMVEIPSAIEIIDDLADECDFFSIGTNDLIQYLLAADRTNEKVASYYNPTHPAVIRSIARVAKVAKENKVHNIEVSICGDIGANPNFLPFFIGLGIRHFSIDPKEMYSTQSVISSLSTQDAKALAHRVLTLKKSKDIQTALQSFFSEKITNND